MRVDWPLGGGGGRSWVRLRSRGVRGLWASLSGEAPMLRRGRPGPVFPVVTASLHDGQGNAWRRAWRWKARGWRLVLEKATGGMITEGAGPEFPRRGTRWFPVEEGSIAKAARVRGQKETQSRAAPSRRLRHRLSSPSHPPPTAARSFLLPARSSPATAERLLPSTAFPATSLLSGLRWQTKPVRSLGKASCIF